MPEADKPKPALNLIPVRDLTRKQLLDTISSGVFRGVLLALFVASLVIGIVEMYQYVDRQKRRAELRQQRLEQELEERERARQREYESY